MKVRIEPGGPVSLDVPIPGSKSLTNRALVAAALARGTSRLTNASFSDDSRLLARGLNRLGLGVEERPARSLLAVRGRGGAIPAASGRFNMGNAGTAIRFFASLLCLGRGRYVLDGDARMRERPIGGLVAALRALGAEIEYAGREGYPPLRIRAGGLRGGRAAVSGETSSQFVSSLLLSAPAAEGEVSIEVVGEAVSKPYIDITVDVMRRMGVEVGRDGYRSFRVREGSAYRAGETAIESDGASANYFLAMAAAAGDSSVATSSFSESLAATERRSGPMSRPVSPSLWQLAQMPEKTVAPWRASPCNVSAATRRPHRLSKSAASKSSRPNCSW